MARVSNSPALKLMASRKLPTLPDDTNDASVVSSNAWRGRGWAKGISKGNTTPTPLLVGIGVGAVAGITLLPVLLTKGRRR